MYGRLANSIFILSFGTYPGDSQTGRPRGVQLFRMVLTCKTIVISKAGSRGRRQKQNWFLDITKNTETVVWINISNLSSLNYIDVSIIQSQFINMQFLANTRYYLKEKKTREEEEELVKLQSADMERCNSRMFFRCFLKGILIV